MAHSCFSVCALARRLVVVVLCLSAVAGWLATEARAQFGGTRWDKPGPKKAVVAPAFGNGEVDYSIVAVGIAVNGGADPGHPANTYAFDSMLPDTVFVPGMPGVPIYPAGTAELMLNDAMTAWETAATVGGVKHLKVLRDPVGGGAVADGGGVIGGAGAASQTGDIRAAVLPWNAAVIINPPGSGGNSQMPFIPWGPDDGGGGAAGAPNALAHGFYPDTQAANLAGSGFGSRGGDIHFRPYLNHMGDPFGVNWYNDQGGAGVPAGWNPVDAVGLYTVMLHEIGHALGLAHTNNPNDVMFGGAYNGSKPALSVNDVANIKTLYCPPIPEPASAVLAALGSLGLAARRRR